MPKLIDIPANQWQHVMVFGPPKSGKTRLAGELAEHGFDITVFDMEKGSTVLKQLSPEAQARITVINLPDSPTYPIAIQTILKTVKRPAIPGPYKICLQHGAVSCPICAKENKPVEEVNLYAEDPNMIYIYDSGTQLLNSGINHITKNQPEDYKLNWDDWGNLGKLMDRFYSHIQVIPAHVIVITHETEVEMEDGKFKLVGTAGTRNFSRNSAKYFDHVVYVEVKNKSHMAGSSTTYANNILTGSRLSISVENSAQPSLVDIFKGKVGKIEAPKPVISLGKK